MLICLSNLDCYACNYVCMHDTIYNINDPTMETCFKSWMRRRIDVRIEKHPHFFQIWVKHLSANMIKANLFNPFCSDLTSIIEINTTDSVTREFRQKSTILSQGAKWGHFKNCPKSCSILGYFFQKNSK